MLPSALPVSYTHLDVYKRQAEVYTHDPRLMEKLEQLAKKHPDQITRKDAHNFTAVSYTHLDVYKRQLLPRSITVS